MKRLHVQVSADDLAITDPQGLPWETFRTSGESTVYCDSADFGAIRVADPAAYCTTEISQSPCCGPKPGAIVAHPILINRPLVATPLGVKLCRASETVLALLPIPQRAAFTKEDGEPVVEAGSQRVARRAS